MFLVLKSGVFYCNTTIETKNVEFFEYIFLLCDKKFLIRAARNNESISNLKN